MNSTLLKHICVLLVTAGGCIMLYSIIKYIKSLVNLKIQANEQKIFVDWIYTVCMLLMLFFFAAYIAIDIFFIIAAADTISMTNLIVAVVFVFGAVFVYVMVVVLQRMYAAISNKNTEVIKTLVNAVEAKDPYTQGHSIHVANVSKLIYDHMPELAKRKISKARLIDAAILHDIGKIGIPDSVLNKNGGLTPDEWDLIRQHPLMGKKILEPTSYQLIGEIVYCHHERVDGNGYFKIASEKIPLEAKIIAVADTFSALCTNRSYRSKKSYEDAVTILREIAGTQLDAEIVNAFCTIPIMDLETASPFFAT